MTQTPEDAVPSTLERPRARDLGLAPGRLAPGQWNAITDVPGVRVGHTTLWIDEDVRTGATALFAHAADPFEQRVPAGLFVANGYGKLAGATQVVELGELETPIVLTNTLSVPEACSALIDWTLDQPGNGDVRSVNPFVAETNDGLLNDIRARRVRPEHVLAAMAAAAPGDVGEGCVGAGTGTIALGFKAGIGTSSRRLRSAWGGATVGVLVQANYSGLLVADGLQVGARLRRTRLRCWSGAERGDAGEDGSVVVVIATDAPLSDRTLRRLAARSMAGVARTGAAFAHGSGDYAVAFSTAEAVRRGDRGRAPAPGPAWPDERLTPLAQAVAEATEEAVLNALCRAVDTTGRAGLRVPALPLGEVRAMVQERQRGDASV